VQTEINKHSISRLESTTGTHLITSADRYTCKQASEAKAANLLVLAVQLVDDVGQCERQGAGVKQRTATLLQPAASNLKRKTN
jgi:hypothetical protein